MSCSIRRFAGIPLGGATLMVAVALGGCARPPVALTDDAPLVRDGQITFNEGSRQLEVLRSTPVQPGARSTLQLPARVAWDATRSSALRTPLAGQVQALEAEPGQRLKAGQVIAWIISPEFGQAQAEGAKGRAELQQARAELSRVRELHEAGVVSGRELGEAEVAFAASQAEHARALAFATAYGNGNRIDQRLPLRAPIDGVLVERRMSPGMAVSPDAEQPLAVVGDPDRLWLLVDVPERLAARVQVGQQVEVNDLQVGVTRSTVQHVDDFIDSERHVVQARALLDNTTRRFKAGQYVRAGIVIPGQGGVTVPDAAVLLINGHQAVFVDQGGGRYTRHAVQAEELGDGRLWVREGLAEGTRVVTEGGLLLQQLLDSQPATVADAGRAAP